MLRGDSSPSRRRVGVGLAAVVGVAAATLVALGNPGNMGLCGACFVRDLGGALRLHPGPAIFRPELAGLVVGALAWSLATGRHVGRSGSHAAARFLLGAAMAVGALVFLGCPFRMLQRLGGGDLSAWAALPGFVVGVGVGRWFEGRGYSIGKTSEVPWPLGLAGPAAIVGLLGVFLAGGVLAGPGAGDAAGPAHAPWLAALAIATLAGALLSATGFCAISAARQVFAGPRWMLAAAGALVVGYAAVAGATGRFHLAWSGQPVAHGDLLWNALALGLVGLAGALAGGCPVRLLVLTGEGNGDAFVAVAGLLLGGALAHSLGLASAPAGAAASGGPTAAGQVAVACGLGLCLLYAAGMGARRRAAG